MQINEKQVYLIGWAEYEIIDHYTGKVLKRGCSKNTVVNNGLTRMSELLNQNVERFTKIAIGTDNTAPTESDTALASQHDIQDADVGNEAGYKATWSGTFTFVSGVTINEAGVFTASGVMLDRVTFGDEVCGTDKDFHIKITVTLARA